MSPFVQSQVTCWENLPSFPGFRADSNANIICENSRGGAVMKTDLLPVHTLGTLLSIPYSVWWRETPPLCCPSPNLCRPGARSPSYRSRMRLPAKWSDCPYYEETFWWSLLLVCTWFGYWPVWRYRPRRWHDETWQTSLVRADRKNQNLWFTLEEVCILFRWQYIYLSLHWLTTLGYYERRTVTHHTPERKYSAHLLPFVCVACLKRRKREKSL